METAFDPTAHQIKDEFLPNKESTWKYPAEEDGWVHAHNSLRFEMSALLEALEAIQKRGAIKEWEVKHLKKAWEAHADHIHCHHDNEDEIMVPYLKQRFRYPEQAITDHEGLVAMIESLGKAIGALKVGSKVDALKQEFSEYRNAMLPHLAHEEAQCLPLARAYFTPEEMAKKVQEIVAQDNKTEMGSLIYVMGVKHFRQSFMRQEGIPWFVWYMVFMWKLRTFKQEFVIPVEALKAGTP